MCDNGLHDQCSVFIIKLYISQCVCYCTNYIAPGMVERNDGPKEIGTLCTKEGQREKERQRKERKRQEEKEIEPTHCSAHI